MSVWSKRALEDFGKGEAQLGTSKFTSTFLPDEIPTILPH